MQNSDTPKPRTVIIVTADIEAIRRDFTDDLATINDYAAAISKTRRTVQRWLAEGRLPFVKIGSRVMIKVSEAKRDVMMAREAA